MSRPYLKINSVSYSSPVLSINYSFYRLRSSTPTSRTISVTGVSASLSYVETHDSVDFSSGRTNLTITFSVPTLGTVSTTTYTAPSLTYTFGGTVSTNNTNLLFTLNGLPLGSVTASTTNVGDLLTNAASSLSFVSTNSGYSVISTPTTLVFSGPAYTGNLYNGATVSMVIANGGASFTYSSGLGVFANGTNNYPIKVAYTTLGHSNTSIFRN